MYFFDINRSFFNRTMLITDMPDSRSYSYGEIYALQDQILQHVPSGSLLFLLCRNHPSCIAAFLGCLRFHVTPLLLDEELHPDYLHSLNIQYRPGFLFLPLKRLGEFPGGSLLWQDDSFALIRLQSESPRLHPELALLLTTSGSTGSPRLVRLSRKNLQSNAASIASYLEITPDDRPVTSLPLEYTYGLSVLTSHILAGAAVLVTDRSFLEPEFWDFFRREKASSLAGVPYSYKILRRLRLPAMDLPSLRVMTQAGGRLPAELQRYFGTYAAERGIRFYIMYGQTEATARMSYLPWQLCLSREGSIGIPIPGGRFELRDSQGGIIECSGREGELIYLGDNVSLGYAASAEDLLLGDERHGRLATGDLAVRDADGFYYITGRLKRFLKVAGKRLSLDTLEQLLSRRWPDRDFACAGEDEAVEVYAAGTEKNREIAETISWFLSEHTSLAPSSFHVTFLDVIPRTSSGKIRYCDLPR